MTFKRRPSPYPLSCYSLVGTRSSLYPTPHKLNYITKHRLNSNLSFKIQLNKKDSLSRRDRRSTTPALTKLPLLLGMKKSSKGKRQYAERLRKVEGIRGAVAGYILRNQNITVDPSTLTRLQDNSTVHDTTGRAYKLSYAAIPDKKSTLSNKVIRWSADLLNNMVTYLESKSITVTLERVPEEDRVASSFTVEGKDIVSRGRYQEVDEEEEEEEYSEESSFEETRMDFDDSEREVAESVTSVEMDSEDDEEEVEEEMLIRKEFAGEHIDLTRETTPAPSLDEDADTEATDSGYEADFTTRMKRGTERLLPLQRGFAKGVTSNPLSPGAEFHDDSEVVHVENDRDVDMRDHTPTPTPQWTTVESPKQSTEADRHEQLSFNTFTTPTKLIPTAPSTPPHDNTTNDFIKPHVPYSQVKQMFELINYSHASSPSNNIQEAITSRPQTPTTPTTTTMAPPPRPSSPRDIEFMNRRKRMLAHRKSCESLQALPPVAAVPGYHLPPSRAENNGQAVAAGTEVSASRKRRPSGSSMEIAGEDHGKRRRRGSFIGMLREKIGF